VGSWATEKRREGKKLVPDFDNPSARERLREVLFEKSHRRLRRRGLSEDEATRVAEEVARRTVERTQTPEFKSDDDFANMVIAVCRGLGEGKSYYELIGERPYLATGRIDRLVATAAHVRPPVSNEFSSAARRAVGLERLAGSLAVIFTSLALVALGIWYSMAVGIVVSVGSEMYVQTGMSPSARRAFGRYLLPRWFGLVALAILIYAGLGWSQGSSSGVLLGFGLAVFALVVAFVIPGLTLALMVGRREHKWRRVLESKLVEKGDEGSWR
jgi:hypothetical protein